ncbi:MAG: phosphotransferase [Pirellulaceae bacterium]
MEEPTWISEGNPSQLERLLQDLKVIVPEARVSKLGPAGDGNMNVTLRAELMTDGIAETLIVKQSRSYVAKYDFIAAPIERIEFESAFYRYVAHDASLQTLLPNLIAWLPHQYLLVLEDLGAASDATAMYQQKPSRESSVLPSWIEPLVQWLCQLHSTSRGRVDVGKFRNLNLRTLNHAHIFQIPFADSPAIELDSVCPGLTDASESLRFDGSLKAVCGRLGALYLKDGDCLLHGDFYPGSWLILSDGPKVIDPEFCFAGPAEFDLGVMLAHLQISGIKNAESAFLSYDPENQSTDWELVFDFAAIEVLRRILGVAQLPLSHTLDQRMALVESAATRLNDSSRNANRSA